MIWVVDCSFSAALFLPDEFSIKARNFFRRFSKYDQVFVPCLWWYEITNVLTVAERRKRLNYTDVIKIFSLLEKLDFETDNQNGVIFSKDVWEIAHRNDLSAYDAVYIELAIRKKASLASLDKQLLNAAKKSGLQIYKIMT